MLLALRVLGEGSPEHPLHEFSCFLLSWMTYSFLKTGSSRESRHPRTTEQEAQNRGSQNQGHSAASQHWELMEPWNRNMLQLWHCGILGPRDHSARSPQTQGMWPLVNRSSEPRDGRSHRILGGLRHSAQKSHMGGAIRWSLRTEPIRNTVSAPPSPVGWPASLSEATGARRHSLSIPGAATGEKDHAVIKAWSQPAAKHSASPLLPGPSEAVQVPRNSASLRPGAPGRRVLRSKWKKNQRVPSTSTSS